MLAHTMGSLPHAPLASASVVYLANVAVVRWLVDAVAGGLVFSRRRGRLKRPGRRGHGGCLRGGYPGTQEEIEDGQCGRRSHVRPPHLINAGNSRLSRRVNRRNGSRRSLPRDNSPGRDVRMLSKRSFTTRR